MSVKQADAPRQPNATRQPNAGPRGKREQTKIDNRRAILAAARIVFIELGYEAASVRDIIRRTDLASGTFYNYFKSKEEVHTALVEDSAERVRPMLIKGRDDAESVEDYVLACYRAFFVQMVEEHEPVLEALGDDVEIPAFDGYTPVSRAVFDDIRAQLEALAEDDNTAIDDVEFLTASLIAVAEAVAHQMLNRRPLDPEAAAAFASRFALEGFGADPAES